MGWRPLSRDELREALTLAKIDHHAEVVDELDVESILAFAERILPRVRPLGAGPSTTSSAYRSCSSRKESRSTVSLNFTSWNRIGEWLRRVEAIRYAA
jgi:hypothetical protein